ncbi:MAG: low molecular weight protein arginine phosphatase [Clostridia bacterium]|nr:low molecular weight protein arginine phosphatase [Clostridia bacterium]
MAGITGTAVETEAPKMKTEQSQPYLFVCSGNTCRSPMAAAMFNYLFGSDGRHAVSAGLIANGSPISSGAVNALVKRGVPSTPENDYLSHKSRLVTRADLANARLVIAVTGFHATQIIMKFPEYATKVSVMPEDIPDPYGGSDEEYEACLSRIEDALRRVFPPAAGAGR